MVKKHLSRIIAFSLLACFLAGFKTFSSRWDITKEDPTLWLKFDEEFLLKEFDEDSVEDYDDDEISALAPEERRRFVIQRIMDNYNDIKTSFIRLSFYPVSDLVQASTASEDSPFTETAAEFRTITFQLGVGGAIASAGWAAPDSHPTESGKLGGCLIAIGDNINSKLKSFIATLTHEVGHCLGLDHNHSDWDAVMGYNSSTEKLGVDDKMGITFLYPAEASYAEESPTLGLTCERKSN